MLKKFTWILSDDTYYIAQQKKIICMGVSFSKIIIILKETHFIMIYEKIWKKSLKELQQG